MTQLDTVQEPHRPRFALLGGSFNPPHRGHVELVRAVLAEGGADHVFAVPAHRSPFKGEQPLLPGALRWEMMRAALREISRVSVLDVEIRRPPPSYTVQTLELLTTCCPNAEWSLVMGSDVLQGFRNWLRADRILELAGLIVAERTEAGRPASGPEQWRNLLPAAWAARAQADADGALLDRDGRVLVRRLRAEISPISSTHIREDHLLESVAPGAREILLHYRRSQAR